MSYVVKKALKLAAIGFPLGMIVGALVLVVMGFANGGELTYPKALLDLTGSQAGALLAQMLISGAYGTIPMAGVVFYELDSWSLAKQCVVHYLTYTVAFLVLGVGVGWFGANAVAVSLMAGIFAVFHLIIWLVMYARYRAEVKELNKLLDRKR